MKQKNPTQNWIAAASLGLALTCWSSLAAVAPDLKPTPAAMQPGGDPNDTTLRFGQWWNNNGVVTEEFDTTMHSSGDISGSIHVVIDCPGGTVTPINSANLAFGNFLDATGDNGWLGAGNSFDAAKYQSLTMDINIATTVSSNSAIPIFLYGADYGNVHLTDVPITNAGWQHLVIPIPSAINLPNCTAYGVYDWYNTTASTPPAHIEYWFDNVTLIGRVPPGPPTLSIAPFAVHGLVVDSAPGEGGQRGAIDTVNDVRWTGEATAGQPVIYAMTIGSIPDPASHSNFEAHIFLAPNPGVGNPDWNLADMGYLQVLANTDGTATARMMWKTNDANDNKMLFNIQPGGEYGTNGYAAGTLGFLTAPTMLGTWSIDFTSDTDFVVRGPGGVHTNFSLPAAWVTSYNDVNLGEVHAYFGGGPNGNANAGQPMALSQVGITGGVGVYIVSNDFSSLPIDTTVWGLLGNETSVILPQPYWEVKWTLPAANFGLWSTASLNHGDPWLNLTGNTNLPVPITSYAWGTNDKALVAAVDLPGTTQNFFALKKLVATKLQVLMPGEVNAPFTVTGKTGTPTPQSVGTGVDVTVNAVDGDWNIVNYATDTVHVTSSDVGATLPPDAALVNGTGTFTIVFATSGSQAVTASDVTTPGVAANTGSSTTINP